MQYFIVCRKRKEYFVLQNKPRIYSYGATASKNIMHETKKAWLS